MRTKEIRQSIVLGIFVLIGTILFLVGVFFVGNNETLFQRSFVIYAEFRDAAGLQAGDNVWLTGVKVGTISAVDIMGDSTVHVAVRIKKKYKKFIKEDVIASIGRDGVMGNRILILKSHRSTVPVQEEQIIASQSDDQTSDLIELLRKSGTNIHTITEKIKVITEDVESGKGIIGELLTNEMWKSQFGIVMTQMEITSQNTAVVTGNLLMLTKDLRKNKSSLISTLVTDTTFSEIYSRSQANIEVTSENTASITGDFREVTDRL